MTDDPSIDDLLNTIKLVGLLNETMAKHEQTLNEIAERFARIERRLTEVEARAA